MLSVQNLNAWYGAARILYYLSFEVGRGEVVALMGRNGAGKSTTMKAIMGLIAKRAGAVHFNGDDISTLRSYQIARRGLGYTPEDRRIFVDLTVEENLDMGSLRGEAKRKRKQTKEMVFSLFPRLRERSRQPAGTLSGGEQQMVAIGRGLMSLPKLMMFDEPVGLDGRERCALVEDRARARREDSGNRLEGRRLARPVGADERDHLSLLHIERHVPQDLDVAVVYVYIPNLKHSAPLRDRPR